MQIKRVAPLYEQLASLIEDAVRQGAFPDGRLPVERDLSEKYNVSRGVVNAALALLEERKIVMRPSRRAGTLVCGDAAKFIKAKPVILVTYSRERLASLRHSNMYGMIIEILAQKADTAGLRLELHPYAEEDSWSLKILSMGGNLAGCLTFLHSDACMVRELFPRNIPVVSVDHCILLGKGERARRAVHYISADNRAAGQVAGGHLKKFGHRRLALYGFDNIEYPTCRDRLEGIRDSGIEIAECGLLPSGGDESLYETIKAGASAIVAYNDHDAIICLNRLMKLGLKVPDDVSIITFDDIHPLLEELSPKICAMRMPVREMAEEAWRRLAGECAEKAPSAVLPYSLASRESVGTPQNANAERPKASTPKNRKKRS